MTYDPHNTAAKPAEWPHKPAGGFFGRRGATQGEDARSRPAASPGRLCLVGLTVLREQTCYYHLWKCPIELGWRARRAVSQYCETVRRLQFQFTT